MTKHYQSITYQLSTCLFLCAVNHTLIKRLYLAEMRLEPYYAHYSPVRRFIFNVISSKFFDLAIAGVIALNVVTMALEYYMMPEV